MLPEQSIPSTLSPVDTLASSLCLDLNGGTAKERKVELLRRLGFKMGDDFQSCLRIEFFNEEDGGYLRRQVELGNRVVIRRLLKNGEKGAGFPVVYIKTVDDLNGLFSNGQINFPLGTYPIKEEGVFYEIFSTSPSDIVWLKKNSEDQDATRVRAGGGFRMQINQVNDDGIEVMVEMILDDRGVRELENNPDLSFRKTYLIKPNCDYKQFQKVEFIQSERVYCSEEIADWVINIFFRDNLKAFFRLVDILMTFYPRDQMHSVEVLFGLRNGELKYKVIDLDGLDTFVSWGIENDQGLDKGTTAKKGLQKAQNQLGIAALREATVGLDILNQIKKELDNCLRKNDADAKNDLLSRILKRMNNQISLAKGWWYYQDGWRFIPFFSLSNNPEHQLALFCRDINLWQDDPNNDISVFNIKINQTTELITVDLFGYGMCFLIEEGQLVEITDVVAIAKKIAKLTGREFLPIFAQRLYEGD